ncbi:MAG: ankyrin repeat domain-containing protein, partial [Acidimicrobiia bacterium]
FDIGLDPRARPTLATPLLVAAGAADATVETMTILLDAGADPFARPGGDSALRFAAAGLGWNYPAGGDADRLALLLGLGLAADEVDRRGVSLVADACWHGDGARVALLLAAGASPDPAPGGRTPTLAAAAEALGLTLALPPGPQRSSSSSAAMSFQIPLFGAAAAGDVALLDNLVDASVTVDVVEEMTGRTAMFAARSAPMVRALTLLGLELEQRDQFGWTPLIAAVNDEDLVAVSALIEAGADPNATTDRGYTVFMSAASERSVAAMAALVNAGADPHAVSELGWNAVHATVDTNSSDPDRAEATFRYLRELGVDFAARDRHGRTPLERAAWQGTDLERDLLERYGPT